MKTILVADDKASVRNLVRNISKRKDFTWSLLRTGAKPFTTLGLRGIQVDPERMEQAVASA